MPELFEVQFEAEIGFDLEVFGPEAGTEFELGMIVEFEFEF